MKRPFRISLFIFTIGIFSTFCISSQQLLAQVKVKPSSLIKEKKDTAAWLRGVYLSVDGIGLIQKVLSDYGQYEAGMRVNIKDKYFPAFEIGYGQANHSDDVTGIHYNTQAPYGKIGIDFNILRNKHDIYKLFVGFRYAYTSFRYDISSDKPVIDPVWGTVANYGANNVNASYHWAELIFGLDAKIWGPFHLGWSARYRNKIYSDEGEVGNVWYIPGYGTKKGSKFWGTFNISIKI